MDIAHSKKMRFNKSLAGKYAGNIFWYVLLIGLSFIILYPFLIKLSSAFMSVQDTYDNTVALIPRHPTSVPDFCLQASFIGLPSSFSQFSLKTC